jgi:hypothetical protein
VKKGSLVLTLLMLLAAAPAGADGKFYGPRAIERVPPEIPYQRALLMFARGQETLVLQSKYRLPNPVAEGFGWVVPVPSVPEVASMEAWYASWFFEELDAASMPDVHRVRGYLLLIAGLLSIGTLLTLPLVALATLVVPCMRGQRPRWALLLLWSFLSCIGLVFIASVFMLTAMTGSPAEAPGIEIVKAEQVGIYDVQVIRSRDAADLIKWLNQHQLHFDEEDTLVFEDYLQRGWYFVVATVDPTAGQGGDSAVDEGLVAPLILRFQAAAPVYPLALTATAGQNTQVLLYLLGEHKWKDDRRLDLYFAGSTRLGILQWIERLDLEHGVQAIDPVDFFLDANTELHYLCRYKGTLSPREMREDLTFTPAGDNEPYRRWMLRW